MTELQFTAFCIWNADVYAHDEIIMSYGIQKCRIQRYGKDKFITVGTPQVWDATNVYISHEEAVLSKAFFELLEWI